MPRASINSSKRWYTLKIVILTSLFWISLQSLLLVYNSGPNLSAQNRDPDEGNSVSIVKSGENRNPAVNPADQKVPVEAKSAPSTPKPGLLGRIVDAVANGVADVLPSGNFGEMGRAVHIPRHLKAQADKLFKVHQFNLMASDLMSLNRSLPDYRMPACREKSYPKQLPDTSVVIVFHNEAWSTLLRTVHSVINRSPRKYLHEILMIDDASTFDHLGEKLNAYVATFGKTKNGDRDFVRVVRMGQRSGLIRARLRGADEAEGQTLTFLDAHCEVTEGWLEPLLVEIATNPRAVACPIIDVINDSTFEYGTGSDMTWGGFNWRMVFKWYPVPERENIRRKYDRSLPLRTPTMAGGLFTIGRQYFFDVGAYDRGMEIWGGENLEMSFRIWMCGGELLIVTCSRVGHVFRKTSPYSWPGGVSHILNNNNARTVKVWLDDYQEFYFKAHPDARRENSDVSDRVALREKLQCKPFKWYLTNIYPEAPIAANFFSLGWVRVDSANLCLDSASRKNGEAVALMACHNMGGNQVFAYTDKFMLQQDEQCLTVVSGIVKLDTCQPSNDAQKFQYKPETKQLFHENSGLCLSVPKSPPHNAPALVNCQNTPGERWSFENMKLDDYPTL